MVDDKTGEHTASRRPWFFFCPLCHLPQWPEKYDGHLRHHAVTARAGMVTSICDSKDDVTRRKARMVSELLGDAEALQKLANQLAHDPREMTKFIWFLTEDLSERCALSVLLLPPPPGAPRRLRRAA
jgi:hypothetical protein